MTSAKFWNIDSAVLSPMVLCIALTKAEGESGMPIYEYRCLDCDHEFECMQKFSDPPVTACPTCAGSVQKLISRSAFHLKGDGWYVTDYARKSGTNGKTDSSDSASKQDKSTESSTDSKTESKTESTTASKTDSSSSSTQTAPASAASTTA